ncbi:MAG: hypothetical protein H7Y38_01240 [Armatimonadetes bacterium]|nr:hypothetical protein [Armatimonadota bacterium]
MIRIVKPVTSPDILQTRGAAKRVEDCAAYDTGIRLFSFEDAIYAEKGVKELLIEAQYGKCAFCESYVADDGHVEHFRPKSAVRSRRGKRNLTPGYYWLAYD